MCLPQQPAVEEPWIEWESQRRTEALPDQTGLADTGAAIQRVRSKLWMTEEYSHLMIMTSCGSTNVRQRPSSLAGSAHDCADRENSGTTS